MFISQNLPGNFSKGRQRNAPFLFWKQNLSSGSPQLGLLTTLFLFFIPKGACISLASCPSSPMVLIEKRARDRRFLFQVESHGKHRQSLMGRERRLRETSTIYHCKATAKGTRSPDKKSCSSIPACHLLFRHQHLVVPLFPAVTPTHQMNTSRDILDGEASTQELPPRSEGTFRQLFPTTPKEAGAEGCPT